MQKRTHHRVLQRQIKKYLGRNGSIPEEYEALFEAISESYEHSDKDRYMLERSVDLSSNELLARNTELIRQKQELESTLEELRATQAQLQESEKTAQLSLALKSSNELLQQKQAELATAFDDLQSAQAQLVQSEKMSSLGQLTAGVAHEINNPINFVYGGIQALKLSVSDLLDMLKTVDTLFKNLDQYNDYQQLRGFLDVIAQDIEGIDEIEEDIYVMIKDIMSGAERTSEIVKGLRNFSRLDDTTSQMADLHECIDSTLLILNSQLGSTVRVHKQYDSTIDQIECYASSLNQVFMNILTNAIQAMKHQGDLFIRTKNLADEVQVYIKDSGPGIPEKIQQQIFNPFFTTKDIGEGTGLGLSISYGIIEKHHGNITINSPKGQGATFIITLPKVLRE